jgi:hypothetical protein
MDVVRVVEAKDGFKLEDGALKELEDGVSDGTF